MTATPESTFAEREAQAHRQRVAAFDQYIGERERFASHSAAYHEAITRLCRFVIPEGQSVLEIGCATGDLLAAVKPSRGVGIDLAPTAIARARARHPQLSFYIGDAETLDVKELAGQTFDYVILSDVVGFLNDVWAALRAVRRVCNPRTRIFISYYNFVWEPLLTLAEQVGLKAPAQAQNWLGMQDLRNLLALAHLEIIREGTAQLLPVEVPALAPLANRYLAQAPGLRHLALTQFFVCKVASGGGPIPHREYSCSVIVPCKNERGNIDDIVARTPDMGRGTEIIFVDGNSTDGTVEAIEEHLLRRSRPSMRLIHQGDGKGKGDAVRKGFAAATGDVLFILDADLTVPPEDLPKFYAAIAEGVGEFINGSRLVYPMEDGAMRVLNSLGNKAFSIALSAILEQRLKDTLCGTKVLFRRDYERIAAARSFFGDFDPFGDFDLLFGAAKQNLKIVEMPVRYRARLYGDTKISRFRHGAMLLRMTAYAFRRFKTAY